MEDFQDPLLKNLYDGLQRGESPASLVEQETDQVTRHGKPFAVHASQ